MSTCNKVFARNIPRKRLNVTKAPVRILNARNEVTLPSSICPRGKSLLPKVTKKFSPKKFNKSWLESVHLSHFSLLAASCTPSPIGAANICGAFDTDHDEYSTSENGVPLSASMSVSTTSYDDRYLIATISYSASSGSESANLSHDVALWYGPGQISDTPSLQGCDGPEEAANYSGSPQPNRVQVKIKFCVIMYLNNPDVKLGGQATAELVNSQNERVAGYGFDLEVPITGFWACS